MMQKWADEFKIKVWKKCCSIKFSILLHYMKWDTTDFSTITLRGGSRLKTTNYTTIDNASQEGFDLAEFDVTQKTFHGGS